MMTARERRILDLEMGRYREYALTPRVCPSCHQTFLNGDFLLAMKEIKNSWFQRLCPECHKVWEETE